MVFSSAYLLLSPVLGSSNFLRSLLGTHKVVIVILIDARTVIDKNILPVISDLRRLVRVGGFFFWLLEAYPTLQENKNNVSSFVFPLFLSTS